VDRNRDQAPRILAAAELLVILLQEPHEGVLAKIAFGKHLQASWLAHSKLMPAKQQQ